MRKANRPDEFGRCRREPHRLDRVDEVDRPALHASRNDHASLAAAALMLEQNVIGTPFMPQNVRCWFNASKNSTCPAVAPDGQDALALQQPGQFGSAGRNILRAPGTSLFDIGVERGLAFTERVRLTFRWEAFNLFNTPQFGRSNTDLSSSAVGTITSLAADRR